MMGGGGRGSLEFSLNVVLPSSGISPHPDLIKEHATLKPACKASYAPIYLPLHPFAMSSFTSNSVTTKDPFDDSLAELRQLISTARSIHTNASERGVVSDDAMNALKSNVEEAEDLLRLLQEVLQKYRLDKFSTSHELQAVNIPGHVWLQRETAVVDAANDLYEVSHSAKKMIAAFLKSREQQMRRDTASSSSSAVPRSSKDEFLEAHHLEQVSVIRDQDETLGRVHEGLRRVQENTITIQSELTVQEGLLNTAQSSIDLLKEKMAAANSRVDSLLQNMSTCKQVTIIVVLCLILGMLIFSIL